MRRVTGRCIGILLAAVMLLALSVSVCAMSDDALALAVTENAEYMYRTVKAPQVGSIGGEWAVIGLARSGYAVPDEYYRDYYAAVETYVKNCKGVLHEKKYTEYSRVITALSAIGKDAGNVAGYDLTYVLGDYDKTIRQGLNGPIWALIALDSRNYPMPINKEAKTQATRQMYIDHILECQLPDGGWNLFGGAASASAGDSDADPDITGMALQALAKYQDQEKVKTATEKALTCISEMQNADGGFGSWGTTNSESCVQILVALCELGIPLDDPDFVKNGKSTLDNLMTFCLPGNGFCHTADGSGNNQMASEQGLYGLVAAQRAAQRKNSLYRMGDSDFIWEGEARQNETGLPAKHEDVHSRPVTAAGKTFEDIVGHPNQAAIEALASRGVIDGKGNGRFDPDANMTRAEFAAIVVRALDLAPKANNSFTDVTQSDWFAPYVGAACTYGIVNGVGGGKFAPYGTITRQEAATMVSRAAKLCGMDTALKSAEIRDVLAQFSDYVKTADWARESLAFCFRENILDQTVSDIQPGAAIKRCEIAQILCNLLSSAKLL